MTDVSPLPVIVRDYLYVDIARVRSLLSQIANGAPDVVIERSARVRELYAGLSLGPLVAGTKQNRNVESEETRSLSDLHFALFEESAEAVGLLSDITHRVQEQETWHSGAVAASLQEGRLIRVTAPVRLVDPAYFKDSLGRIDSMIESFLPLVQPTSGVAGSGPGASVSPTQRSRGRQQPKARGGMDSASSLLRQRKQELMGDLPPEALTRLGDFVGSLLGGGISMRCMPCGEGVPDCAFSGVLLDRSAYIEPERAAIFGRFGPTPANWTLVALVTRFGSKGTSSEFAVPPGLGEGPSRLAVEELVVSLLAFLEGLGVADAPAWPTIAVTPLALYRLLVPAETGEAELGRHTSFGG